MTKWHELVLAIPKHAGGQIADSAASALLKALVGTQNAQISLLQDIRRDVKQLLEGAFKAGRMHLNEALKPYRTREARLEMLKNARTRFTDALGVERDKTRLSLISLHLGVCWLLLDSIEDARSWTAEAQRQQRGR